jgi:glycosyltransferase involved in cell wall biosynthesis
MSAGMSMDAWNRAGIIHRELSYYRELSQHIGPLSFISYGDNYHNESQLLKQHIPDADIVWTRPPIFDQLPSGLFLSTFLPPLDIKSFTHIKRIRTNQISGAWAGAYIAKQLKIPIILRAGYILSKNINMDQNASLFKKKLISLLEKWLVKHTDAIIVTYSKAKEYIINNYTIPPSKITIIGNPIDTEMFSRQNQSVRTRRDILFIGRFMPEKNIQSILEACHLAKVSITLLGKGPLKKSMIEFTRSFHIDAQFIESIPNTQIPQLMGNHRLFMIASIYEGNPKVLLEAMSCEMPCIASNIPEHINVINHEKEGLIVPSTPESLAKAVLQLLQFPDFARKLGAHARMKILKEYSLKRNALRESQLHERMNYDNRLPFSL